MVKLVYIILKREYRQADEFYTYWRDSHAPKVRSAAQALKVRKYVQSHMVDTPHNAAIVGVRKGMPSSELGCGIAELWWDSLADLQAAFATEEGQAAGAMLVEDEERFIDFTKIRIFMTDEHTIFDFTDGET